MNHGLILDFVIQESAALLELLAIKDKTLLVRWDALFILNLGLHVSNCVRRLDVEGDCFACECFNENLHVVCYCLWRENDKV